MNKLLAGVVTAVIVGVILLVSALSTNSQKPLGSVSATNEYLATSTAPNSVYGGTVSGSRVLKTGSGSLAQITITGANTGIVNFYNATTSNVLARTGQPATTTILIASLPASLAAGTYTFDAGFYAGLYIDLVSGDMPTSTVTYR